MKRKTVRRAGVLCVLLCVILLFCGCEGGLSAYAPSLTVSAAEFVLPDDSFSFSPSFARVALSLCSGHTAERTRTLAEKAGFSVNIQKNYEKPAEDVSHTSGYTVASRVMNDRGTERLLVLVIFRGTEGGEWASNFDFSPSGKEDAVFSENFLLAAQDALQDVQSVAGQSENPLFVVAGHSRGGGCANLFGVLLNACYGAENVFCYTFAAPATVRGDLPVACENIFNIINPADVVPYMPLASWGYRRVGQDILLNADMENRMTVQTVVYTLSEISADVPSYYEVRHSLTDAGESETGLTAFEVMLLFSSALTSLESSDALPSAVLPEISPESDFAPLANLWKAATAENGRLGMELLKQHLPVVYDRLLEVYEKENG